MSSCMDLMFSHFYFSFIFDFQLKLEILSPSDEAKVQKQKRTILDGMKRNE